MKVQKAMVKKFAPSILQICIFSEKMTYFQKNSSHSLIKDKIYQKIADTRKSRAL